MRLILTQCKEHFTITLLYSLTKFRPEIAVPKNRSEISLEHSLFWSAISGRLVEGSKVNERYIIAN